MTKKIALGFLFLLILNSVNAANYYWVGGTGYWLDATNHWATTSGGNIFYSTAPTAADNVFFDSNSGLISNDTVYYDFNTVITVKDFTVNGIADSVWFHNNNNSQTFVYGSVVLNQKIYMGQYPWFNCTLKSNNPGNTITTSGTPVGLTIDCFGDYNLTDSLINSYIGVNSGTFNSNNHYMECSFNSNSTIYPVNINLGQSEIHANAWDMSIDTYLTFHADSSVIYYSPVIPNNFYGGNNQHYNIVHCSDVTVFSGYNYYKALYTGGYQFEDGSSVDVLQVNTTNNNNALINIRRGETLRINNILSFIKNDPSQYLHISAYGTGSANIAYLANYGAAICLDSCYFTDISASVNIPIHAGSHSFDMGDNTNIVFTDCSPPTLAITGTDICNAACSGTATANVTNGFPPFTYQWSTGATSKLVNNLCAGNYSCTVTDAHGNTSNASVQINTGSPLTMSLGPDITVCDTFALVTPSINLAGNYAYQWGPAPYNFTNQYGLAISKVYNQLIELTITDTISGCTAYDAVTVTSFNPRSGAVEICPGDSLYLDLGAGGTYQWTTYTDTLGNVTTLTNTSQGIYATQPGAYAATVSFPGCGPFNMVDTLFFYDCGSQYSVMWPGDCNNDLVCDATDFLYLGMAFNQTGPQRKFINDSINNVGNISWTAQNAPWWPYAFSNAVNYTHADGNGDGVINYTDANAINANYNLTHLRVAENNNSNTIYSKITVTALSDTVKANDLLQLYLQMEPTFGIPMDSSMGTALRLGLDYSVVDPNSIVVDFTGNTYQANNANTIDFTKVLTAINAIDMAVCRTNQTNFLHYGLFAKVTMRMLPNITAPQIIYFNTSNILSLMQNGTAIQFSETGDSVVVVPSVVGLQELTQNPIIIFPNPARDLVYISGDNQSISEIEMTDITGKTIYNNLHVSKSIYSINTSPFTNGIYVLKTKTALGSYINKIIVAH